METNEALLVQKDFKEYYDQFFSAIYKLAFLHTKRAEDAADITQDVFLRLYISEKEFSSTEHVKAWLLTCTHNACMDYFRSKWRKNIGLDDIRESGLPFAVDETLGVLLSLPDKYKTPIYMYYYQGYSTQEIAQILRKPPATVRVSLHRGREQLRKKLKGGF